MLAVDSVASLKLRQVLVTLDGEATRLETCPTSTPSTYMTCAVRAFLPLVSPQTCRLRTPMTPSTAMIVCSTWLTSTPSGAPSSRMFRLSFSSTHVRGITHRPMATATTVSTQAQPVKRMTTAATMTPSEPSMSAHTSRYAPFTLRLASLPARSSRMLIKFYHQAQHGDNEPAHRLHVGRRAEAAIGLIQDVQGHAEEQHGVESRRQDLGGDSRRCAWHRRAAVRPGSLPRQIASAATWVNMWAKSASSARLLNTMPAMTSVTRKMDVRPSTIHSARSLPLSGIAWSWPPLMRLFRWRPSRWPAPSSQSRSCTPVGAGRWPPRSRSNPRGTAPPCRCSNRRSWPESTPRRHPG